MYILDICLFLQACKMMMRMARVMCCLLPPFYCCQYKLDNLGGGKMQGGLVWRFQAWSTGALWVKKHCYIVKALWLHLEPTPLGTKVPFQWLCSLKVN